jgi:formyl-CoA transferase
VLAGVKALLARERGGAGQHVEVSMLEVAAWFAFLDTAGSAILPEAPRPAGSDDATSGKRITLRFADGWGMLSLGHDTSFRGSCEVFGVDLNEKRHLLTMAGREADRHGYEAVLEQFRARAAGLQLAETAARLLAAEAMFAEVLEPSQIPANEQAIARRLFVESQHPLLGRVVEPRLPAVYSKTQPGGPRPSSALGQHNDEVRSELLGLSHA